MRCRRADAIPRAVSGASMRVLSAVRPQLRLRSAAHLFYVVSPQLFRIMNAVQILFLLIQYGFEFSVVADAVSGIWPAAGFLSLKDVGVLQ